MYPICRAKSFAIVLFPQELWPSIAIVMGIVSIFMVIILQPHLSIKHETRGGYVIFGIGQVKAETLDMQTDAER